MYLYALENLEPTVPDLSQLAAAQQLINEHLLPSLRAPRDDLSADQNPLPLKRLVSPSALN